MALIDIDWKPPSRQLRQFAGLFLVFFGIAGTVHYFRDGSLIVSQVLWGLAAVVGLVGLIRPRVVWPVYVAMMAVALPIGMVVSTVLMVVIYYLVLTPIGLLMRMFGYDAMKRRFDPSAETYWIRHPGQPPMRRYFRQF